MDIEDTPERDFEARIADSLGLAYRVAFAVVRQREDAEDVAQEAFLRAYRGFGRLRERERFRAWLVRIVWRLAHNRLRSNGRRRRWEEAVSGDHLVDCPSPGSADVAGASTLRQAIDDLPHKLRLVVILFAVEGRDTREVARLLGIPEGTVKSRMHLARKRLMETLA